MSLAASTDLLYGVHPVLEALRAKDVGVHRIYLQEGRRGRAVEEILRLAKARHVPVAFEAREDLDRRAGSGRHQGAVGIASAMAWCASRSRVKCRASTPRWRRRLCCTRCCGSEPAPVPSAPPHPDESFLDGGFEELGGVRHPELLHHVGAVRFDGLYADLEACPDLPVLEAVPDQLEDFLLAVRQGRGPVSLLPFHDRITPYAKDV